MMDRYHIAEALVHDHHARTIHPWEHGNRRVAEAVRGRPRLYPVWVIEPPVEPGAVAAEALVGEMLAAGVRVARLRMRPLGAHPWVWDDLCGVLEQRRVPCFVDFGTAAGTTADLGDFDVAGIREIALAHPELPLVLSHVMGGLGVHPAVVHLIHRAANVHIDITGILEYWRSVACQVGPERVLFATGAPFVDPGILISNVQYADELDLAAKKKICGDNLRDLLAGLREK
jgi:predicted TIM-barrel fold metal-dependent hydrolase